MTHRNDAHKLDFLRSAVVGLVWAIEPMSRIATNGLSSQQLYNELVASQQLHVETRAANAKDGTSTDRATTDGDVIPSLFAGQGMYANASCGIGANSRLHIGDNCGSCDVDWFRGADWGHRADWMRRGRIRGVPNQAPARCHVEVA